MKKLIQTNLVSVKGVFTYSLSYNLKKKLLSNSNSNTYKSLTYDPNGLLGHPKKKA